MPPCSDEQIFHKREGRGLNMQRELHLSPSADAAAVMEKIQTEQRLLGFWSAWERCLYLWYTVLGGLRHGIRHRQVINHHDVLVGLIHCGWCLCTRTDGRAAVLDGSSWRLDLRPLKKLGQGRERGRREQRVGQSFWGRMGSITKADNIAIQYYFQRVATHSENSRTISDYL